MYRTGIGIDVHPLKPGLKLMLGCVHFSEADVGLEGHSDADVVAHAVCDALLGAAALGDMGRYFPDTDPKYKNFPGSGFLGEVAAMVRAANYEITSIDCVVASDAVILGERKQEMVLAMAEHLGVTVDRVSVKATTYEGHGAVGRGEVIACEAVATIKKTGKR